MKFLMHIIIALLIGFLPSFAMAKDKTIASIPSTECTLKNKVFCGEWETRQTYHLNVTGRKITSIDSKPPHYTCKIIDEYSDKVHPYSILQCTYYDEYWSKKSITEFHMFYFSDYDIQRNLESPYLQIVSYRTKTKIQDLFMGYCDSAATKGEEKCESNDLYPNIYYDNDRLSRYIKN